MITAGLDEAGRGPILGPMILCGVCFRSNDIPKLKEMGVKDSKLLSPRRREELSRKILDLAVSFRIVELDPSEIDLLRREKNLNEIEAETFARIIQELSPDVAYVDSPDPNPTLFEERLKRYLGEKVGLVVENGADRRYLQVSAASILAKERRDKRIAELHERYGDFGSGYLTDPKTISFLREWVRTHGDLPEFARKSWKFEFGCPNI